MFPIRDTIPSRHLPIMTWALIGLNVATFLYEVGLSTEGVEHLFYRFGVVPARYTDPQWALSVGLVGNDLWPLVTSMFLHGGFLHILANMWTLWIFGVNVEDRMGPFRFLAFYLLCGLLASVIHGVTNAGSTLPTVGASGAIAGVLGAYLVLYPTARVVTVFPVFFYPMIFELPAVLYLGIWFLSQLGSGVTALAGPDVGGVAWWAHIGGFVAGILLLRWFKRSSPPPRSGESRHFVMAQVPQRRRRR